jgi:hypothetical protein
MRAIEAKTFSGYGGLQQIELAKPQPAKGRVLVRKGKMVRLTAIVPAET